MSYVDDLIRIIKSVKTVKDFKDENTHKSIARGALDGTMQFPCLVSDSIPIDMASTVARTLERTYASFVQSYLSLNNTIDISVDKNPNMFLKKFHHNIKVESTDIDLYHDYFLESDADYDSLMERIYDGTTKAYINERANKMIVFNLSTAQTRALYESNQKLLEESLSSIDFEPFPNIGNSPYYEDNGNKDVDIDMYGRTSHIDTRNKMYQSTFGTAMNFGTGLINRHLDQKYQDARDARSTQNSIDMQNLKAKQDMDKTKFTLMNNDKLRVPMMTDNDIKKSNDLQPYLMQVRLMAVNDENEFVQFMDFIVGVKVVLHNIKSNEMIINIQNVMQNNGRFFNFIRWTTGEKSLFKDLLFHINDVKLDVANKSKGASPWWLTLKRMKETSRAQAAFFSKTRLVPNATIVLSEYEVSAIKNNYGMDLRDPRFAIKLMKSLFLMNFVILDSGTRTIEILYDGERTYQTYALETLEREVSLNSNKIGKELTRMIGRQ